MSHNLQHCPKCIIDDGGLAAAARLLADNMPDGEVAAEARHLAATAKAAQEATECALHEDLVSSDKADELHAMSELSCHRAASLRAFARGNEAPGITDESVVEVLQQWAEELRLHTTGIVGGEYNGAFTVDGVKGISRKGDSAAD